MFPLHNNNNISACLIAKNNEKTLERCLLSVSRISDEIIYVDTGSTDKSLSIAANYTNNIFHYKWNENFSEARNYALDHVKSKWVVFLDTDEYLKVDSDWLRNRLAAETSDVVLCSFFNEGYKIENKPVEDVAVRIFRNSPNIRYTRSIHEYLIKKPGTLTFSDYRNHVRVFHTGYSLDSMYSKNKYSRNISMLLKELSKNPYDAELHFYIADMYRLGREWMKTIFHLDIALKIANFRVPQHLILAQIMKALALMESGCYNNETVLEYLDICEFSLPERAELLACRGLLLESMGKLAEARTFFNKSLEVYKCSPKNHSLYYEYYKAIVEKINLK